MSTGQPLPRGAAFLTHLRQALDGLPETQQRIGEFASNHPIQAAQMTITELADQAGTSAATVTRFYRALGLSSYSQLRLELATAAQESRGRDRDALGGDILPTDSLALIIDKTAEAYARMITESARFLDADDLDRIARTMVDAGEIRIFGMGGAGTVSRYLQGKLRSLGLPAIAFRDPREALIDVANAGLGDVLVMITQSGALVEADEVLAEAIDRGVITVALTAEPDSPIARRADHVLRVVVRTAGFSTGTLSSRHVEHWLIDCLCTAILIHRYDESTAALARVSKALGATRDNHR